MRILRGVLYGDEFCQDKLMIIFRGRFRKSVGEITRSAIDFPWRGLFMNVILSAAKDLPVTSRGNPDSSLRSE